MTARVVVVGSLNVDQVVHVATHPRPGETVLGHDLRVRPGGKGANQALGAARAGAAVQLVGRVGDDAAGHAYRDGLAARGVEVAHVRLSPGAATGTALITVAGSGENSIVVAAGANSLLEPADVEDAAQAIQAADVLLVQLEVPVETVVRAVEVARRAGVRVVVNPSPLQDLPAAVVAAADPLVVNEHEAAHFESRDTCVTLGGRGATWRGEAVKPPPVDVVDTTGAGDVFAGSLAAGLARGLSPGDVLRVAVEAATLATTWTGAQDWELA